MVHTRISCLAAICSWHATVLSDNCIKSMSVALSASRLWPTWRASDYLDADGCSDMTGVGAAAHHTIMHS
jgi:hypothetical protein